MALLAVGNCETRSLATNTTAYSAALAPETADALWLNPTPIKRWTNLNFRVAGKSGTRFRRTPGHDEHRPLYQHRWLILATHSTRILTALAKHGNCRFDCQFSAKANSSQPPKRHNALPS